MTQPTNLDKCSNCQDLSPGSILRLDEEGNCAYCGRYIGKVSISSNLDTLRAAAREKLKWMPTITGVHKHYLPAEDLDEIVTSTYLQAVQDCA